MTAIHLETRDGGLCHYTPAIAVADLEDVTCKHCLRNLKAITALRDEQLWERAYLARATDDCEAVGIGHLWSALGDSAYDRLVRDLIASVARYFVERDQT